MVKEEKLDKYNTDGSVEDNGFVPEVVYDLANNEDLKEFEEEVNSGSMFFNPEKDITYKVEIMDTKVKVVEKTFEEDSTPITKYQIAVKTLNEKKEEFEGVWEVGKGVMKSLLKDFNIGATFKITKTGSGLQTKYNVIKDF